MAFLGNLRHLQSGFIGKFANSIHKRQIIGFHLKLDNVTMRPAAETMVKPLSLVDGKRRGLFIMEWTTSLIFAPFAYQFDF